MEISNQISATKREVFRFYQDKLTFYLDVYILEEKFPPKRNYMALKTYNRLMDRFSTIPESEVPLTENIKEKLLQEINNQIQIKKWSER